MVTRMDQTEESQPHGLTRKHQAGAIPNSYLPTCEKTLLDAQKSD